MNRKIGMLFLILACLLALAGCQCEHEWEDADCTNAKTCRLCGETEGEALGHSWVDATCTAPKTCETCGAAEGEALGHSWVDATCTAPKTCETCGTTEGETIDHTWADATCAAPQTCTVCQLTEGEALGHSWEEATTEAPKTCTACGATEGERIITDPRFTSAAAAPVVGSWTCAINSTEMEIEDLPAGLDMYVTITFGRDGVMTMDMEFDKDNFIDVMLPYMIDVLYAEFEALNMDRETADAAMQEEYGMTIPEYAAYAVEQMDSSSFFGSVEMVYYVEDGQIYGAEDWDSEMEPIAFTLEGDTLTLNDPEGVSVTLTRAAD